MWPAPPGPPPPTHVEPYATLEAESLAYLDGLAGMEEPGSPGRGGLDGPVTPAAVRGGSTGAAPLPVPSDYLGARFGASVSYHGRGLAEAVAEACGCPGAAGPWGAADRARLAATLRSDAEAAADAVRTACPRPTPSPLPPPVPLADCRPYEEQAPLDLDDAEAAAVADAALRGPAAAPPAHALAKLTLDLWARASAEVAAGLTLLTLKKSLASPDPGERARVFDLVLNAALHAELLGPGPLSGLDTERGAASEGESAAGTPASRASPGGRRLRTAPGDSFRAWLRGVAFELVDALVEAGEECERVWQGAAAVVLHLAAADGRVRADAAAGLGGRCAAALAAAAARHAWPPHVRLHLTRTVVACAYGNSGGAGGSVGGLGVSVAGIGLAATAAAAAAATTTAAALRTPSPLRPSGGGLLKAAGGCGRVASLLASAATLEERRNLACLALDGLLAGERGRRGAAAARALVGAGGARAAAGADALAAWVRVLWAGQDGGAGDYADGGGWEAGDSRRPDDPATPGAGMHIDVGDAARAAARAMGARTPPDLAAAAEAAAGGDGPAACALADAVARAGDPGACAAAAAALGHALAEAHRRTPGSAVLPAPPGWRDNAGGETEPTARPLPGLFHLVAALDDAMASAAGPDAAGPRVVVDAARRALERALLLDPAEGASPVDAAAVVVASARLALAWTARAPNAAAWAGAADVAELVVASLAARLPAGQADDASSSCGGGARVPPPSPPAWRAWDARPPSSPAPDALDAAYAVSPPVWAYLGGLAGVPGAVLERVPPRLLLDVAAALEAGPGGVRAGENGDGAHVADAADARLAVVVLLLTRCGCGGRALAAAGGEAGLARWLTDADPRVAYATATFLLTRLEATRPADLHAAVRAAHAGGGAGIGCSPVPQLVAGLATGLVTLEGV